MCYEPGIGSENMGRARAELSQGIRGKEDIHMASGARQEWTRERLMSLS